MRRNGRCNEMAVSSGNWGTFHVAVLFESETERQSPTSEEPAAPIGRTVLQCFGDPPESNVIVRGNFNSPNVRLIDTRHKAAVHSW